VEKLGPLDKPTPKGARDQAWMLLFVQL